jgi:hypothetical protein
MAFEHTRRHFLQTIATAGTALGLGDSAAPKALGRPNADEAIAMPTLTDDLLNTLPSAPDDQTDKTARRPNVLIIGASSWNSPPFPLPRLVGAMLESKATPMNLEGKWPQLDAVSETLSSKQVWDYVIMDAWHLGREQAEDDPFRASVPRGFPKAVAAFVKEVRAHSPRCKIILFPWWIPGGPKATNEGAMEVFRSCVEQARVNNIWVATTGPAFMEARLQRPVLHVIVSKTDAHPGVHGAYINACSLVAMLTGQSPVGLPATIRMPGREVNLSIAPDDAKYLQELAWKVYQREIKNTKPAK